MPSNGRRGKPGKQQEREMRVAAWTSDAVERPARKARQATGTGDARGSLDLASPQTSSKPVIKVAK